MKVSRDQVEPDLRFSVGFVTADTAQESSRADWLSRCSCEPGGLSLTGCLSSCLAVLQLHIVDGALLRSNPALVMEGIQKFLGVTPVFNYTQALMWDTHTHTHRLGLVFLWKAFITLTLLCFVLNNWPCV